MALTTDNYTLKINVETQIGEKSIRQMKAELKDLTTQFEQAQAAGNKPLADNLLKQMGVLKNDIKDTAVYMKQLDPGELLSGFVKLGQGAVGSFAAITGAMTLFGSESEKVKQIQQKSMAIIQTMIGLEQFRATFLDSAGKAQLKALYQTTAAQIKQLFYTQATTVATIQAEGAQAAFNKTAKLNPYALIAAAVIAAGAALVTYANTISKTVKEQNAMVDVNADVLKSVQEQKINLEFYTKVAKDTTRTEKERKIALENIKEITGGVINIQDLSVKSLKKLDEQTNIYIQTLLKKAKVQAAEQKIIELAKSNIDLEAEIIKERNDIYSKNLMTLAFSGGPLEALKMAGHTIKSVTDIINGTDPEKIDGLYKIIADNRTKDLIDQQQLNNKTMEALQIYINENKEIVNLKKDTDKTKKEIIKTNVEEIKGRKDNIAAIQEEYDKLLKLPEVLEKDKTTREKYVDDTKQIYLDDAEEYTKLLELQGDSPNLKKALQAKNDLLDYQMQQELDAIKDNEELKEEIRKKYVKLKEDNIKNEYKRQLEVVEKYSSMVANTLNKAIGFIMDFNTQANEEALKTLDDNYTKDKNKIDKQLEDKIISKEQYDAKIKKLDEERAKEEKKLKHEQFEKDRAAQIATTTITGIVGAINALSTSGPVWLGIVMAALVAAETAASVALIGSEKNPYAKGGLIPGPSHAQGGVQINAEGGEAIVNKNSMSVPAYRNIVSAINVAGGGVPIPNTNQSNNSLISASIDTNTIASIVDQVTNRITSIPVVVVESDISKIQRRVKVIENGSIIG